MTKQSLPTPPAANSHTLFSLLMMNNPTLPLHFQEEPTPEDNDHDNVIGLLNEALDILNDDGVLSNTPGSVCNFNFQAPSRRRQFLDNHFDTLRIIDEVLEIISDDIDIFCDDDQVERPTNGKKRRKK
jgi:hypothetical protein